jgi:glycosyltransferase involved in cell wall biosynthesis
MVRKKVSVVIPTFNGQALLAKNLRSVIDCLRTGDELIIVDDASTDQSVTWMEKEFKTDKHQIKHHG